MLLKRSVPAALVLILICSACGKKADAPVAPEMAAAPPEAPVVAAAPEDAVLPIEPADDSFVVDEPMPPVDESGAPPRVVARGTLMALDPQLSVHGEMTIYQADDGTRLLRLENVEIAPATPAQLAFTRAAKPVSAQELQGRLNLGALKGSRGNMNYLIDRALDLSQQRALVVLSQGDTLPLAYCPLTRP